MNGQSYLPNDPKIIVCICFGAFWICNKMLSYGRLTTNCRIVVFKYTRWLFSYGTTFLPAARGNMLLYSVCWPLQSASYVTSFTSARTFINYTTSVGGRNFIFLSRWQHNFCVVKHTRLHIIEIRCNGYWFDFQPLMKHDHSRVILGILGTSLDQAFFLPQSWLVFD